MTDAQINNALRTGQLTGEMLPYIFANAEWAVMLGPWVFWGFAAALVVAEAVEFFLQEFSGRPKMTATIDEARVLKGYSSPVLQTLAVGAAKLVNAGIPVSSPDAGPLFGQFFVAAQKIENAIRFGNQSAGSIDLTNATLTNVLHESGNPGVAGTQTLQATQNAWDRFHVGQAIPGSAAYTAVKALANQGGSDPASTLSRSWAQTYISHNPGQFPEPPPPPPPPPPPGGGGPPGVIPQAYAQALGSVIQNGPPGREIYYRGQPTGKYAVSWYDPPPGLLNSVFPGLSLGQLVQTTPHGGVPTIHLGEQISQVLHDTVVLTAQLHGGPYPQAHVEWRVDGQLDHEDIAETTTGYLDVTVGWQWNTKTVPNGNHNLNLRWVGHLGTIHEQISETVRVQNATSDGGGNGGQHQHQCPPGYGWNPKTERCEPIPPPPIPLPWDVWFKPCEEVPNCQNLGSEALAVVQSIANVAAALNQIFRGQQSATMDPCCHSILIALTDINNQIVQLVNRFPAGHDVTRLIQPLDNIVNGLHSLAATVEKLKSGGTEVCDLKPVVEQLKKANEQRDIPHELIKQFLDDKVLPPQMSGLLQHTPADWVHAALQYAAEYSPVIGFAEYMLGDEKDAIAGRRKMQEHVKNVVGTFHKVSKGLAKFDKGSGYSPLGDAFKEAISTEDTILEPTVKDLISTIKSQLIAGKGPCPPLGDIGVEGDKVVSSALGVAISAAGVAWLMSFGGIDEGESLTKIVDLIAGAIGFEELKDVEVKPLVTNGIQRVAEMRAKNMFRQEIPGAGAGYGLAARGLIAPGLAHELAGLNGLACILEKPMAAAAYHGMNARQMLRLIETGLFSHDEIIDELTFNGMRPTSRDRMLRAAPYLATQPQRSQLRAEIEKAAAAGLLSEQEVHDRLEAAEHNTDRNDLSINRLRLETLQAFAKDLEFEYSTMFAAGLINEQTFRANLTHLTFQEWKINGLVARGEARQAVTLSRQEAAAARAETKATATAERKAAIGNYLNGHIPAPALTAALIATGMTPIQTAAAVDLATLQREGRPRHMYGKSLSSTDASLLQGRISALKDQRRRELITDTQFTNDLKALGLTPHFINAIRAAADATLTPAKKAFEIPVELNGSVA